MGYTVLKRKWPVTKRVWIPLLATELAFLIPLLVLFGISQPNMYRTLFWRIGHDNGFNSNPNLVIFAMTNAQPLPKIPFVWSQTLTNFNVAITVVNLFVLLVRMTVLIMKVCYPIITLAVNVGMVTIWTVSIYGQIGPDHADPARSSSVAWYISKSCEIARPYGAVKSCIIAKSCFALSVCMLAIMLVYLGISIWAMLPTNNVIEYDSDDEDDDERDRYTRRPTSKEGAIELQGVRRAGSRRSQMATPFTPRTEAFHVLDRRYPLRQS